MTYDELLKTTAEKKTSAIRELNKAVNNPLSGFLARAEIERRPGSVAWYYLAHDFCDAIINNLDELLASVENQYEKDDIVRIYMAYYDDDPDLYELLPVEAQLFTE